ncbi:MAG: ATP-binding protein [Bacteroidales bacterium]
MRRDVLFLVIFIALLLVTFLINDRLNTSPEEAIDEKHISQTLDEKQKQVKRWFHEVDARLADSLNTSENVFDDIAQLEEPDGIFFCLFDDDRMVYWNDNQIAHHKLDTTADSSQIVKLDNGWYWHIMQEIGSYKAVGLVLIKHEYPYENQYINDAFQEDFNIPGTTELLLDEETGIRVEDNDGRYLFSLVPDEEADKTAFPVLFGLLFFGLFFVLLAFLYELLNRKLPEKKKIREIGIVIAGIALLRYFMVVFKFPGALYELPVFDPSHYASSSFIPSLGDLLFLLISTWFVLYLILKLVKNQISTGNFSSTKIVVLLFLVAALNACWFVFSHHLVTSVIYNSNITLSFYNFFDLSVYSFLALLAIFLIFVNYFMLLHLLLRFTANFLWRSAVPLFLIFSAASVGVFIIAGYSLHLVVVIFFLIINLIYVVFLFKYQAYYYSRNVLVLFFSVLFLTFFLEYHSGNQEKQKRQVLVTSLENERDRVGEYLFQELEDEMQNDTVLQNYMQNHLANEPYILEYIQNEYFHGYFRKYELQISVCDPNDELEVYEDNTTEIYHCYSFFEQMIHEEGVPLSESNFYFLDNFSGRISYIGVVKFNDENTDKEKKLYVSIDSKLSDTHLGYPELLLDKEIAQNERFNNYSYAKYQNNVLVNRSGNFPYPTELDGFFNTDSENQFVNYDGFNHLVYRPEEDMTILISKANRTFLDLMAQFSYIFAFCFILFITFIFLYHFPNNLKRFNYNFKNKIKLSLILLLLLSMIAVGTGTVYYTTQQFRDKQKETISEKLQSILVELENNLHMETELKPDQESYLTNLLVNLSNVFYVDMNLYDLDGRLIASSRMQVFEQGLLGRRMDAKAYRELAVKSQPRFIHSEVLGNLQYHSAYVPFYNEHGETLAYLNVPYFTRQQALKKEVYTVVMVMVNIYVFLIIIGTLVAVLVSNNITRPLRLIRHKLEKIGLNRANEKIEYDSYDEIGELIREYNRMVDELDENARRLAQTERETAWREMAKQIAHEIKNPLTPMKLKVQYLKRAWDDRVSNFDHRIKQFTEAMISQINALSFIATEFGNFAKMPPPRKNKIDIKEETNNVVNLFEPTAHIDIYFEDFTDQPCYVYADADQLRRVMSNLLKNSIQSIPSDRKGEIVVRLETKEDNVILSVIDNGRGITEDIENKLFYPNFTTKSGGMGMGLAISKKIVEDTGGTIWYETQQREGTVFYVKLPVYSP